jgi:hypothetical protein
MPYDRLIVESDEDGWVTFRRADMPPSEQSHAMFQVPKGFQLSDVLEAARATGWVIERYGGPWIDHQTGCQFLANFVLEMLYYFDAPNRPSKRLRRIQRAVDQWLAEEGIDEPRLSSWAYTWLDLVVRDDAKEDVLTAEDVWRSDVLQVDLARHRDRRLRQVLERTQPQAAPALPAEVTEGTEAEDAAKTGRMAPSQRTRRPAVKRRKDVG